MHYKMTFNDQTKKKKKAGRGRYKIDHICNDQRKITAATNPLIITDLKKKKNTLKLLIMAAFIL